MTDTGLSRSVQMGLRASLVRRFLTEDLDYINTAKHYLHVPDFCDIVQRVISTAGSRGQARRQEFRPPARLPHRAALGGLRRRPRQHPDPADVVRVVGRPARRSSTTTTCRTSTTGSTWRSNRSAANTRISSRRSRTRRSRRRFSRASRWPSTTSATSRWSSAVRACSRTGSARRSRASTRACSWPTAARSASGCWRSSTPSPRCTRRSSARTPSSTAPNAACSISTKKWAS